MANWNAGLQGAASGAAAGSAFGHLGAAIGGVGGGILGLMQNDPAAQRRRAVRDYQTASEQAANQYAGSQKNILGDYGSLWDLEGVQGAKQGYTSALGQDANQYGVDQWMGSGTYTPATAMVSDYMDPSLDYQQQQVRKNIEESAAGQGGLYSGAAAREIASAVADQASQGWQQALQNAQNEQSRANQVSSQNLQNAMAAGQYNVGLQDTNLGRAGTQYGLERDLMDTELTGQADLNKMLYSNQMAQNQTALQSALGESGGEDIWGKILGAAEAGKSVKSFWD